MPLTKYDIDPGVDGDFTITINPEISGTSNLVYVAALRLEESGGIPEPSTYVLALIGLLSLAGVTWRSRQRRS